jgi:hypothetical protein
MRCPSRASIGIPAGPLVGALLDRLLETVIADPERNERETLLADVRSWLQDDRMLQAELAQAVERERRRGARGGSGHPREDGSR